VGGGGGGGVGRNGSYMSIMTYFLCDCNVADCRSSAAKHSRVFHIKEKKTLELQMENLLVE